MYEELKLGQVEKTLVQLRSRIEERFPGSNLGQVAEELVNIAQATGPVLDSIRKPHRLVRAFVVIALVALVALAVTLVFYFRALAFDVDGVAAMLNAVESAAQDAIFLALAIYFLLTLESRIKRRISLNALRRLRSIVHIVDMHQLTKDPEHLLTPGMTTASSPERKFTRFGLARYLDYCAELLSLSSKLAALHAQYLNDPVVLGAVNDIEVLASNLSNKIWQKIVILDTSVASEA